MWPDAASTTAAIGSVIESDLKADLIVQSQGGDLPEQVADAMAATPSVAALDVADTGYVMETGTISFSGSGKDLLADDRVRKAYLGEH